jgi:hypothetical protein
VADIWILQVPTISVPQYLPAAVLLNIYACSGIDSATDWQNLPLLRGGDMDGRVISMGGYLN